MRYVAIVFGCLLLTSCTSPAPPAEGAPVLFEGARLISSDGSAPVENSAFIVEKCQVH